jgi:hypothetical protein
MYIPSKQRATTIRIHIHPTSFTSRQDRPGKDIFCIHVRSTSRRPQQQTRRLEMLFRRSNGKTLLTYCIRDKNHCHRVKTQLQLNKYYYYYYY